MPLIEWTNELSVNVRSIDEQHKKLIGMINDLHDAMREGKGSRITGDTVKNLIDYTKTHFAYEEQLMKSNGYPGFLAHKAEHEKMVARVLEFDRKIGESTTILPTELARFLKDWLTVHILNTDKRYGPFLAEKGVV